MRQVFNVSGVQNERMHELSNSDWNTLGSIMRRINDAVSTHPLVMWCRHLPRQSATRARTVSR